MITVRDMEGKLHQMQLERDTVETRKQVYNAKELSLSHALKFSYCYVFATCWCKPLIFQT